MRQEDVGVCGWAFGGEVSWSCTPGNLFDSLSRRLGFSRDYVRST